MFFLFNELNVSFCHLWLDFQLLENWIMGKRFPQPFKENWIDHQVETLGSAKSLSWLVYNC